MTLDNLKTALQGAGKAKKSAKKTAKKAAKKGTLQASTSKSEKMSGPSEESPHGLPAFAKQLDTNHDGRLSREELSKAADLFDKLDRDHDGFLDANELSEMPAVTSSKSAAITPVGPLKRMAKKGGKFQGRNLAQVFQKADADGDGKLSMEETPPFLKKRFSKIDTNSDGFLDKGELEIWIHHHHKFAGRARGDGIRAIRLNPRKRDKAPAASRVAIRSTGVKRWRPTFPTGTIERRWHLGDRSNRAWFGTGGRNDRAGTAHRRGSSPATQGR